MIKHMKVKGITFDTVDEQKIIDTLSKKNYYFKLTAYRNNFTKDTFGKYQNLDFACLTDLASIDAQFRYYLLKLSLNIEHGVKTTLVDLITRNDTEDGYSIISDFREYDQFNYDTTMKYLKRNKYLHDLYIKHKSHPSAWMFLEVATFGALSSFVDFYFKRTKNKKIEQAHKYLKYAKNIRNACAHNNSILVNLFSEKEHIARPNASVVSIADNMGHINRSQVMDMKVNDLVCLFYLHKKFTSNVAYKHFQREGKRFLERTLRHKEYYLDNKKLIDFYTIVSKLINY